MTKNKPDSEARREQALRRLEGEDRCVLCGETFVHCLERHHVAQARFGDELVTVCRNCHRKASDAQRDHPAPIDEEPPSFEESAGHLLLGFGDFLRFAADALIDLGRSLIEQAQAARSSDKGDAS